MPGRRIRPGHVGDRRSRRSPRCRRRRTTWPGRRLNAGELDRDLAAQVRRQAVFVFCVACRRVQVEERGQRREHLARSSSTCTFSVSGCAILLVCLVSTCSQKESCALRQAAGSAMVCASVSGRRGISASHASSCPNRRFVHRVAADHARAGLPRARRPGLEAGVSEQCCDAQPPPPPPPPPPPLPPPVDALTVQANWVVPEAPVLSVALTVTVLSPAAVGLPVIRPLFCAIVRPDGGLRSLYSASGQPRVGRLDLQADRVADRVGLGSRTGHGHRAAGGDPVSLAEGRDAVRRAESGWSVITGARG